MEGLSSANQVLFRCCCCFFVRGSDIVGAPFLKHEKVTFDEHGLVEAEMDGILMVGKCRGLYGIIAMNPLSFIILLGVQLFWF